MKSPVPVVDAPVLFVTTVSVTPAACAGIAVTAMWLSSVTVKLAAPPPIVTPVVVRKLVPTMVCASVAPAAGPKAGVMLVTVGSVPANVTVVCTEETAV